jgi:hypothetical protein
MLAGSTEHRDHKGNHGLLTAGSIQWMTAGRGIIHSGTLYLFPSLSQIFISQNFRNAKTRKWAHVGVSVMGKFASEGQNGIIFIS